MKIKIIILNICMILIVFKSRAEESISSRLYDLEMKFEKLEKENKKLKSQLPNLKYSSVFDKFSLGGYIKLDMTYDFGVKAGYSTWLPEISTQDEGSGDTFIMNARESRINLKYEDESEYGKITGFMEYDFFGTDANETINSSHGMRLRHAYFSIGSWTFGQTWSNFEDLNSMMETLDFGYNLGLNSLRQAQIRYTHKSAKFTNSFSIENPESDFIDSNGNSGTQSQDRNDKMPDLTFKTSYQGKRIYTSLAGVYRKISASNNTSSDSVNGYAFAWANSLKLFNRDRFSFRITLGDGVGRYIRDAYNHSATLNQDNYELEKVKSYAYYVGYKRSWNKKLVSNFIYGYIDIDNNTDIIGEETTKNLQSMHSNLIYSLTDNLFLGIEYMFGSRELDNENSGYIRRLQFSSKLSF